MLSSTNSDIHARTLLRYMRDIGHPEFGALRGDPVSGMEALRADARPASTTAAY
jgi:hypothetical protein